MKTITKISMFVFFVLIISSLVYAETNCNSSYGKQGYNCTSGNLQELNNNYDCKEGKICNGDYCCGTSANLYCCKKLIGQSCGQDGQGYTCISILDPNYNQNNCISNCNNNPNFVCCKKMDNSNQINTNTQNNNQDFFNFFKINGVQTLVSNYQGLTVGANINYNALQERSLDPNTKIKSLYAEALGYKEIAALRREYLGISPKVLQSGEAQVITKASGVEIASGFQGNLVETNLNQSINENLQSNTTIINKQQSAGFKPSLPIIIKGNWRTIKIFYDDQNSYWKWCKTGLYNNECSGSQNKITKDSPNSNDFYFVGQTYSQLTGSMGGKDLNDGISELLFNSMKLLVNQSKNFPLEIEERDPISGNKKTTEITLLKVGTSIDIKIGNVKIQGLGRIIYSEASLNPNVERSIETIQKGTNFEQGLQQIVNKINA